MEKVMESHGMSKAQKSTNRAFVTRLRLSDWADLKSTNQIATLPVQ